MDENRCSKPRKHDVRLSGELVAFEPKPKSLCVEESPDQYFGLGVLALDATHDPTAFGL
jgi:hypothetical protein